MSTSRIAALVAVAGTTLGAPAATAGAQSPATRPHSKVVTYDRGDVRIQRLQMAVTRSGGRLHATVNLTVRNESRRSVRRELQVGRCTGGEAAAPVCPASATFRVRLAPGAVGSITRRVTLRQPSSRTDSIQAALVAAGTKQPFGFRSDGLLLLKGGAWRGAGAGRTYGVAFGPGDGARRLNFDIPVTGPDRARIDVKWQGPAAPTGATTTISRCAGAACAPTQLRPARSRSGPQLFGNRFAFSRGAATSVGLRAATADGTALFDAELPWPA
ncbi:MAG: hypothetical protein QOH72_121 [Solirubrobacteraceae bacterium]|nr:hypothetical protein [Solirubrobacteraceae bacterium]